MYVHKCVARQTVQQVTSINEIDTTTDVTCDDVVDVEPYNQNICLYTRRHI